jgi:diaminopimelate decarboxylase
MNFVIIKLSCLDYINSFKNKIIRRLYLMKNNLDIIKKLMAEYQRPFYIYDESVIFRQVTTLSKRFPHFEFLYSIKTNPYTPIVNYIVSRGFGADAASAEEVAIAQKAGLSYEKILYSSPGKTHNDIEKTIEKAIIVADSYNELALINNVAKKRKLHIKVGLRINPNYTMDIGKGISSKFGVDEETIVKQKDFLNTLTNIDIVGIHVHLRSQILHHNILYRYYEKIFELALFCKETMGWKLEFIDFGGGLGIAYSSLNDSPLDIQLLIDECEELFQRFKDKINARLIIETGRFLVCEAGQYVTHIVDIKESRGVKYLIVENGLNGFLRPSIAELLKDYTPEGSKLKASEPLFTAKDTFEFTILERKEPFLEKVSIVGNLCTSTDIMAKDIMLPKAALYFYISQYYWKILKER